MKIVQWAMPYLPIMGGREVFVHRLASSLAERGHEVTVLAPDFKGATLDSLPSEESSFRVVRLPLSGLFVEGRAVEARAATALAASALQAAAPDVVHAHNVGPDLMVLREAMTRSRVVPPIGVPVHGLPLTMDSGRWSIARYAERVVDAVVAVSEATLAEIAMRAPALGERLVLVRNGVPLPVDPPAAQPLMRALLVFGRLSTEKGVACLLVAFSILLASEPEWRLVVAGDGPERAGLERLARHLGISDHVEFTGWLDQASLLERLRECLLVAVPSIWDEPFGLVAAEAHAAARAVLATRTGALPEIVQDGETGWLVPPGDPLALASVLRSVAEDPAIAVAHGQRARARAEQEFGWNGCVTAYERLYERLAVGGGR